MGTRRRWPVAVLRALLIAAVAMGPYFTVSMVWGCADIFSGLMAFPNLLALIVLSPVVAKCTREYFGKSSE